MCYLCRKHPAIKAHIYRRCKIRRFGKGSQWSIITNFIMATEEERLKDELTRQDFIPSPCGRREKLEQRKAMAQSFAQTENGISVLSDFEAGMSYIYSGALGGLWGIAPTVVKASSAFEEEIFALIPPEELMERHITELRLFQLQKSLPADERENYSLLCLLHFRKTDGGTVPILHRSYYLERQDNGSVWLSLCLYTPFVECGERARCNIVNNKTGETLPNIDIEQLDRRLISPRERSVLDLLAKGMGSKQIAETLNISVNTVSRHRQNILAALQVSNTAAAVEIALRLHLIG